MSNLPLRPGPVLRSVEADDETIPRLAQGLRIAEALLFASSEPLEEEAIARMLPQGVAVQAVLAELETLYRNRGVNLARVAGKWMFRTAPDLGYLLKKESHEEKKLGRAALETLAIIAYHQPVTRAEIEELRGVSTNKGTIDALLEAGFIRLRGRRRTPGRPVTFGTTETFLIQFGLDKVGDLPSLAELAGMGMADPALSTLGMPLPTDDPSLRADEDPLEPDLFDAMFEERMEEEAETPPLDPDGADVSAERENPSRPRPDPDG
jgi:segregation and condensation protein B